MSYREKLQNVKNGILNIIQAEKQVPANVNNSTNLANIDDRLDLLLLEDSEPLMQMSVNYMKKAIRLIIMLDVSGSMVGTEEDIFKGISKLVTHHKNDNILFNFVVFNSERYILLDDVHISNVVIPNIEASGGTNLNGTLYHTIQSKCNEGVNLVVTISDGADTYSEVSANEVKNLMKELSNKHNHFYFLGEPTMDQTPEEVYHSAYQLGFDESDISIFTRKGNGNKLNFEVISKMLDELLKYGTISNEWSRPIKEHYLALTDKRL